MSARPKFNYPIRCAEPNCPYLLVPSTWFRRNKDVYNKETGYREHGGKGYCTVHYQAKYNSFAQRGNKNLTKETVGGRNGVVIIYNSAIKHTAEWMERGACVGEDPRLFDADSDHVEAAKICQACPVQTECLKYALDNLEDGYWAGTTRTDREDIRYRRTWAI